MNPLHYPCLELCKKLTEIGFPKTENSWTAGWLNLPRDELALDDVFREGAIVCPSVMEMLDVIPTSIIEKEDGKLLELRIVKNSNGNYSINFLGTDGWIHKQYWGTLTNALAVMILWLHKNGHVTFNK